MSDSDCRNDCTLPLRFPRRPGTQQATIHGDGCPCCYRSTGVSQDNRPALSRFNYRIGSYGSIREFLFHEIDKTPELLNWTHRAPDDPAVALLEGASILGDVLTFYQEIYANEAYLRTARWRESISDLVRLLGYRLSPAVGGNAVFAFEIKKEEPVVIPAGFPVKATLEKLPDPANFETLDQLTAYPWLSRFNLYKPLVQKDIEHSTTEFYISKPEQLLFPVELKPGDRLLMGEIVAASSSAGSTQPSAAQIIAGEALSATLLEKMENAVAYVKTAFDAGESSVGADGLLIEAVDATSQVAASEAQMAAVTEAIEKLVREEENAYGQTTRSKDSVDAAVEESTFLANDARAIANDTSLFQGVDPADLQFVIDEIQSGSDEIKDAALDASNAIQESVRKMRAVNIAILGLRGLAATATRSEEYAKLADQIYAEAVEKAARLAALAASSAAAGAADRVEAFDLAREANDSPLNDSALDAMNSAARVPGAIDQFAEQAIKDSVGIGATVLTFGPLAGLLLGALLAALPTGSRAKYDAAKAAANATQSKTAAVKAKTQRVVDALSRSATDAASQSIIDRQNAEDAITEVNDTAGRRLRLANDMAADRAALVEAINRAILLSKEAEAAATFAVEKIADLLDAIRAFDLETLREAVTLADDRSQDDKVTRLKNAEIVIVDSLRELHGQKIFKIKGKLKRAGKISELAAFKLGRSFHHFGHNGPPTMVKTDEPIKSSSTTTTSNGQTTTTVTSPPLPEKNVAFSRFLHTVTRSDKTAIRYAGNTNTERIVDRPLGRFELPLDAEVTDLATGVTLLVQTTLYGSPNTKKFGEFTFVRKIEEIKSAALTWGLMTGTVSMARLDKQLTITQDGVRYRITDIRDFLVHETLSPLLTIKRAREQTEEQRGGYLNFYGTADEVRTLKGRRIMFKKPGEQPYLRNVSEIPFLFLLSTSRFKQLRRIRLNEPVDYDDFPNTEPKVTVFGNLADANEGKTELETPIGGGDAMQVFQNFKLPKAPLTYHLVPKNTPSETPELSVFVNGREWQQVDSFFGRGKDEHIYIVRQDADGNSWVQFGDGKTGARLPNGVDNVTALYRTGDGAFGPLKEDSKVQASAKLKNLDQIQMPMDATGGAPPEDGESARNAAPAKVQSLGRIVSLKDYEAETIAIPGVVSARAMWRLHGGVPSVAVTVLMETGRSGEIATVENTLDRYDIERGAARNPVIVEGGSRMYVAVTVEYALNPTYRADLVEPHIRRALGVNYAKPNREEDQTGLFSVRRRKFGAREYASSIEGWVQNVDGVLWAKATTFMQLSDVDDPASIEIPGTTVANNEVTCDSFHILSLYDEHLTLTLRAREAG